MVIWCWWEKSTHRKGSKEWFKQHFSRTSFVETWLKKVTENEEYTKKDPSFAKWFGWFWWKQTNGGNGNPKYNLSWVWKVADKQWFTSHFRRFDFVSFLRTYGKDYDNLEWYHNRGVKISNKKQIQSWMVIWCWWEKSTHKTENKDWFRQHFSRTSFDVDWYMNVITNERYLKNDPDFPKWFAWFWWRTTRGGGSRYGMDWVWAFSNHQWLYERKLTKVPYHDDRFLQKYGEKYIDLQWYKINHLVVKSQNDIKSWMLVWCWWVKTTGKKEPSMEEFKQKFRSPNFDVDWWLNIRDDETYQKSGKTFVKWFGWYWWKKTAGGGGKFKGNWVWSVADYEWLYKEKLTKVILQKEGFDHLKFLDKYGSEYTDLNWYKNHDVKITQKNDIENWMLVWCWWVKTTNKGKPAKEQFKSMFGGNNFHKEWLKNKIENHGQYENIDSNFLKWFGWYWMKRTDSGAGKYKSGWVWTVSNYEWIHAEGLTKPRSFLLRFLDKEGPIYSDVQWYQDHGENIEKEDQIKSWMVIWCWYFKATRKNDPSKEIFKQKFGANSFDEDWYNDAKDNTELQKFDPYFVKWYGWVWWKTTGGGGGKYSAHWSWSVSDNQWLVQRGWTKIDLSKST